MIITLTLNSALDLFYRSAKDLSFHAGGKGINVSRVLKRVGCESIVLGCAGGVTGERIEQLLRREGICFEFVPCKHETRTNVTFLSSANREMVRAFGKGHALSSVEIASVKKLCQRYGRSASLAVLSGSLPSGERQALYRELITAIQGRNVPCLLDTHGGALKEGLKARPVYIKPNREEAEAFLKRKLNSKAGLVEAVRRFHGLGVKNVLITLGNQGAVGSDGRGIWQAVPPVVKAVHTVGCGDSFVAGFLSMIEKRKPFPEALKMGVATGTAGTLGKGPGDVHKKDVKRICQQVKLRTLL